MNPPASAATSVPGRFRPTDTTTLSAEAATAGRGPAPAPCLRHRHPSAVFLPRLKPAAGEERAAGVIYCRPRAALGQRINEALAFWVPVGEVACAVVCLNLALLTWMLADLLGLPGWSLAVPLVVAAGFAASGLRGLVRERAAHQDARERLHRVLGALDTDSPSLRRDPAIAHRRF